MDRVIRYMALDQNVRIMAVQSLETIQAAYDIHHFAPTACAAFGRVQSACAIMAAQEKTAANITINFKGDGSIGGIVVVGRPGVFVKGYAQNPNADLPPKRPGKLDVAGIMGRGRLSVVKDLGMGEPWVGQVEYLSGEIAEDIAAFYLRSEQQPSMVALGVLVGREHYPIASGGIVAQPMPGCSDDDIRKLEGCAQKLTDLSHKLAEYGDIAPVVDEVFGSLGLELLDETPLAYACDCSRIRVERALITMGAKDLIELRDADEVTEVNCHFCNKTYEFTKEDIDALLQAAMGEADHA